MSGSAGNIDAAQHLGGGFDPGTGSFVFDSPWDVVVVADPHQIQTFFGCDPGTVAELEVGLFEEVRVFGRQRKTENEKS